MQGQKQQAVSTTPSEVTEITLQRETIMLSPVYSVVINHTAPTGQDIKTGYVRLSAFSQVCITSFLFTILFSSRQYEFLTTNEYCLSNNVLSYLHGLVLRTNVSENLVNGGLFLTECCG